MARLVAIKPSAGVSGLWHHRCKFKEARTLQVARLGGLDDGLGVDDGGTRVIDLQCTDTTSHCDQQHSAASSESFELCCGNSDRRIRLRSADPGRILRNCQNARHTAAIVQLQTARQ